MFAVAPLKRLHVVFQNMIAVIMPTIKKTRSQAFNKCPTDSEVPVPHYQANCCE